MQPMRTAGSVNKNTLAFNEAYDSLIAQYVDPVVVLFKLCKSRDMSIRLRAATTLMNKRFPSQLAIKPVGEGQGEFTFMWSETEPDVANHDTLHATETRSDTSQLN